MFDVRTLIGDGYACRAGSADDVSLADQLAMHRAVLRSIHATLSTCAHPGCTSCNEITPLLSRYLGEG